MRILATFGPRLHVAGNSVGLAEKFPYTKAALTGWQRRGWNAILCAEKVLPYCIEANLKESNIVELLSQAREVVKSGIPPTQDFILELEPSDDDVNGDFPFTKQTPEIERAVSAYGVAAHALLIVNWDIDNEFDLDSYYEGASGDYWEAHNAIYAARTCGGIDHSYYPHCDDQGAQGVWVVVAK